MLPSVASFFASSAALSSFFFPKYLHKTSRAFLRKRFYTTVVSFRTVLRSPPPRKDSRNLRKYPTICRMLRRPNFPTLYCASTFERWTISSPVMDLSPAEEICHHRLGNIHRVVRLIVILCGNRRAKHAVGRRKPWRLQLFH